MVAEGQEFPRTNPSLPLLLLIHHNDLITAIDKKTINLCNLSQSYINERLVCGTRKGSCKHDTYSDINWCGSMK